MQTSTLEHSQSQSSNGAGRQFSLVALTSLFFMWGFITALNDILIPHLKSTFSLSYTQAMLVQFCFFGAYFLISVPAGRLVKSIGYQSGIGAGLLTASLGCLLFIPSALMGQYWMFLAALFVLASGITILQVAANPLVTLLGEPATAPRRLTLTQAFNSLGTTVAPIVGGFLLFSLVTESSESNPAHQVIMPYFGLAMILLVLALVFWKVTLHGVPKHAKGGVVLDADPRGLSSHRHLMLGVIAIFLYVGAEVSIGSFLVNFLGEAHISGMTEAQAANYIAYYWGGAMVGRFAGVVLMGRFQPRFLLAFFSLMAVVLIFTAVMSTGITSMWAILAVGLFNSIMFPTIFSLAIKDLGHHTSGGSGLLCLAIVGGAIVPVLQGMLADSIGLQWSFLLPMLCYFYIAFYGLSGAVPKSTNKAEA
ncbi:sugar MFS transporter [Aliiglaciecola sp. CAU 1673]|uniref:sugar MFS transporter n=1 Tax=Aliiglaciecola sp. CAU 1673 TaxID=3032595 RepID=UPI0023DC8BC0|nr:sugar MFS transporter [Aliiglaciecola sp. CAU 1673]MDF2178809.1 sugar MFS transporter [Aliiglaciecola sp. CAU 1673]